MHLSKFIYQCNMYSSMTKVALLSFLRMLLCGCVLLFLGSVLAHPLNEMSLDAQWDSWKTTHLREYNGLVSVCLSFWLPG